MYVRTSLYTHMQTASELIKGQLSIACKYLYFIWPFNRQRQWLLNRDRSEFSAFPIRHWLTLEAAEFVHFWLGVLLLCFPHILRNIRRRDGEIESEFSRWDQTLAAGNWKSCKNSVAADYWKERGNFLNSAGAGQGENELRGIYIQFLSESFRSWSKLFFPPS